MHVSECTNCPCNSGSKELRDLCIRVGLCAHCLLTGYSTYAKSHALHKLHFSGMWLHTRCVSNRTSFTRVFSVQNLIFGHSSRQYHYSSIYLVAVSWFNGSLKYSCHAHKNTAKSDKQVLKVCYLEPLSRINFHSNCLSMCMRVFIAVKYCICMVMFCWPRCGLINTK